MFENLFPGNLSLGALTVSRVSVIIICVSIVLMIALVLLVNKTRMDAPCAPCPRTKAPRR